MCIIKTPALGECWGPKSTVSSLLPERVGTQRTAGFPDRWRDRWPGEPNARAVLEVQWGDVLGLAMLTSDVLHCHRTEHGMTSEQVRTARHCAALRRTPASRPGTLMPFVQDLSGMVSHRRIGRAARTRVAGLSLVCPERGGCEWCDRNAFQCQKRLTFDYQDPSRRDYL